MEFFEEINREYARSPFNYTGAKYKLLDQIVPHLKSSNAFIDLFCGGGSIFVNVNFPIIIANDIIEPLMEFYKELQTKHWDYIRKEIEIRKINKDSQEEFLGLRERFNEKGNCYDFFMLVCSCTNNMMRFNRSFEFNQTWGKRTYNAETEKKLVNYWQRLYENRRITLLNKPWDKVEIPDKSFVYMDPPYLITEAGYNAYWSKHDEDMLYDFIDDLDRRSIKFAMSNVRVHNGNVNPYLDRLSKYKIIDLKHDYDKVSRIGKKETTEILVVN